MAKRTFIGELPADWAAVLGPTVDDDLDAIDQRIAGRQDPRVFPAPDEVFAALRLTPFDAVRAVILGQDPYPTAGHAHGLSFSVRPGTSPLPGSLRHILAELRADVGFECRTGGSLEPWARHGVLLLNTALTVAEGRRDSHGRRIWGACTDAILKAVAGRSEAAVFLLWGAKAQRACRIVGDRQPIVPSAHPSPLSAHRGFLGSRPFSRANEALRAAGGTAIDWRLDPEGVASTDTASA